MASSYEAAGQALLAGMPDIAARIESKIGVTCVVVGLPTKTLPLDAVWLELADQSKVELEDNATDLNTAPFNVAASVRWVDPEADPLRVFRLCDALYEQWTADFQEVEELRSSRLRGITVARDEAAKGQLLAVARMRIDVSIFRAF